MDRPRIRVDFNEMADVKDLVLLSKTDVRTDSSGEEVRLSEGKEIFVYDEDIDDEGKPDNLLADGVAEVNDPSVYGDWTRKAKWCCRIDALGIRHESDENRKT